MCWARASMPHPITATFNGFFVASMLVVVLETPSPAITSASR
jgi:hypothetical protein